MNVATKVLAVGVILGMLQGGAFAAPIRSTQATRDEIRQIHDDAKAACLAGLSPDHRAAVLATVAKFDAQSLSYDAAGAAVADILDDAELHAIQGAHARMLAAFGAEIMHRQPLPTPPGPDPMGKPQAGRFLVDVVGDPGMVFAEKPNPFPSP